MTDKTSKTETQPRRLPKGQRKHLRQLKQAARKAGTAGMGQGDAWKRK